MVGGFTEKEKEKEKKQHLTQSLDCSFTQQPGGTTPHTLNYHREAGEGAGDGGGGEMGLVFLPSQAPLANSFFSPPLGRAT